MTLSPETGFSSPSFLNIEASSFSDALDRVPAAFPYGDSVFAIHRSEVTTWEISEGDVVLGFLSALPSLDAGGPTRWTIGDPQQPSLGVGASWTAWDEAVASLVDFRRSEPTAH